MLSGILVWERICYLTYYRTYVPLPTLRPSGLPLYRGSDPMAVARIVSAELAISALVSGYGNVDLAAEKLGITPYELRSIIAESPENIDILAQQIRVHTMLGTFDLMSKSMMLLGASLAQLDTYDLSKHTMALIQSVEKFTNDQTSTQNININETLMKVLPPEVREAVRLTLEHTDAPND